MIPDVKQEVIERGAFIPEVETSLFDAAENAQFWLGKVATSDGCVLLRREYEGALRLRANIYIDDRKFLPPDARDSKGGESDDYDARADHYVALERTQKGALVVGTIRAISNADQALPAQLYFPGEFPKSEHEKTIEASRLIAEGVRKRAIGHALMRAIVLDAQSNEVDAIYAVAEDQLARYFKIIGIPYQELSEPKQIDDFNTENKLLRFTPNNIIEQATSRQSRPKPITPYFVSSLENGNQGQGLFPDGSLVELIKSRGSIENL